MSGMGPRFFLPLIAAATLIATPAVGAVATFTGEMSVHIPLLPAGGSAEASILGSGTALRYDPTSFAFELPAGVFATAFSIPGPTPVPTTPFSIYLLSTDLTASNDAGGFAPGDGPGGGFGGVMALRAFLNSRLGVVGVPGTIGSVGIPLIIGSPAITGNPFTAGSFQLPNAVTVTAFGEAWTTGRVTFSDQTPGAPSGTAPTSFAISGSRALGPDGGSVSLVTPFLIRLRSPIEENLAGYARLELTFSVPEPTTIALVLVGLSGLACLARTRTR